MAVITMRYTNTFALEKYELAESVFFMVKSFVLK